MSELSELTEAITKIGVHVENIKEDITEMKDDRKESSKAHWDKLNDITTSIQDEKTARMIADTTIEKDVASIKTKVGIITGGVSAVVTLIVSYVKGWFSS